MLPAQPPATGNRTVDQDAYWGWRLLYEYQSTHGGTIRVPLIDLLMSAYYNEFRVRLPRARYGQIIKHLRDLGAMREPGPQARQVDPPPAITTGYYVRKLVFWLQDSGVLTGERFALLRIRNPQLLARLAHTRGADVTELEEAVNAAEATGQLVVRRDGDEVIGLALPSHEAALDLALAQSARS